MSASAGMSKRKRESDFDNVIDNVKVKSKRVKEDCDMDCLFCFKTCRGKSQRRNVLQCIVCKGILYHNYCCGDWASKCPQCKQNTVVPLREPEGPGKGVDVVDVDLSADDVDNDDDKSTVSTEVEINTTTTTTTIATTETTTAIARASDGMHVCRVGGCCHRSKTMQKIKQHQAAMHDIDVAVATNRQASAL